MICMWWFCILIRLCFWNFDSVWLIVLSVMLRQLLMFLCVICRLNFDGEQLCFRQCDDMLSRNVVMCFLVFSELSSIVCDVLCMICLFISLCMCNCIELVFEYSVLSVLYGIMQIELFFSVIVVCGCVLLQMLLRLSVLLVRCRFVICLWLL